MMGTKHKPDQKGDTGDTGDTRHMMQHAGNTSPVKGASIDLVDNFINRYACEPLAPLFHATGHTANSISVYGTLFTFAAIWYLWKDDMLRFSIYFWVAYVLDCLDGFYARRYNMVTSFGDIFEHVRDVTSLIIMMVICCINYTVTKPIIYLTMVSSLLTGIHVGCVQKHFINHDYTESLDFLKGLCIEHISTYFGTGLYMATLHLIALYLSQGFILFLKLTSIFVILCYFVDLYRKHPLSLSSSSSSPDHVSIPLEMIRDDEDDENAFNSQENVSDFSPKEPTDPSEQRVL